MPTQQSLGHARSTVVHWRIDMTVVAIYFASFTVNNGGLVELILRKCRERVDRGKVGDKVLRERARYRLCDNRTGEWDHARVGKYIAGMVEDLDHFKDLIRFEDEEEAIVNESDVSRLLDFSQYK